MTVEKWGLAWYSDERER